MAPACAFLMGLTVPAAAQRGSASDAAEIQRLQDSAYLVECDLSSLGQRDPSRGEQLQGRLEGLRAEARTASMPARSAAPRSRTNAVAPAATFLEVPVGTEMDVRLIDSLDSVTATVEDRFEGTTIEDLRVDGRVAIPAGSAVRGVVTAVDQATRTNRTARMTLSFDQVTVNDARSNRSSLTRRAK